MRLADDVSDLLVGFMYSWRWNQRKSFETSSANLIHTMETEPIKSSETSSANLIHTMETEPTKLRNVVSQRHSHDWNGTD